VYCGRGDKKTAKGKRFGHSFGNVSYTTPSLSSFLYSYVLHFVISEF